ncbi:MAG: hypothetical protein JL50_21735 [Peptococcaceae bacterium BICA1-7]|nr:MAG: hypothetical protein JL50_21735 [Peptococcaceae bacterium BICA1-7]HBV99360.1 DUF1294 domain-containing protein [Desulfotomaculum sp.]
MKPWAVFAGYLLLVNLWGYFMMGQDKSRSRAGAWRIPERRFLLVSLAGGAAGVILGLRSFRHKTRHFKFTVVVPAILFIQVLAAVWLWQKGFLAF